MKTRYTLVSLLALVILLMLTVGLSRAQEGNGNTALAPEGGPSMISTFTYQGSLVENNQPAEGIYDFQASLYTLYDGGTMVADCDSLFLDDVNVENGLFSLICYPVNYGSGYTLDTVFNGELRYIEIRVKQDSASTYTALPRQAITTTPYAWSLRPEAVIAGTSGGNILDVRNRGVGSLSGYAIYAEKADESGAAIKSYNISSAGSSVVAFSLNGIGVYAQTNAAGNNYGLYTPDNLYSLNIHSMGAEMQVVQNGGSETLEMGDVVLFSGIAAPLESGGPPVVQVARADSANSTAVAGVVYSRYDIRAMSVSPEEAGTIAFTPDGPIPPGEYLLMVVQGPAQVKASALGGAIAPGDLLSTGQQAGYAARAPLVSIDGVMVTPPGMVFGKALETLDKGEKLIYVFVTLQ